MLVTCGRCILYVVYIVHFGAPSKLSLDFGFLHVTFAGCCSFYSLCRCLHCKHNTKTWYFIRQFRTNERTNARRIIIPLLFVNLCCLEINLKSKFIHLYPHFVVFVHYFHFLYNRKFLPTKTYWQERKRVSHEITWANRNNHFVFLHYYNNDARNFLSSECAEKGANDRENI